MIKEKTNISTTKINRKLVTFLLCLLASSFFWLVTVLSKQYATTAEVKIVYINYPTKKVIISSLPNYYSLEYKTSGFRILFHKIYDFPPIKIDFKKLKPYAPNHYYIELNNYIDKLNAKTNAKIKAIKLSSDTFFCELSAKLEKTVSVKTNVFYGEEKPSKLIDGLLISPKTIKISGPVYLINKINYIETETLKVDNLNEAFSKKVNLLFNDTLIHSSIKEVELSYNVARFTEQSLEVPIKVINVPQKNTLKVFPSKAKITYKVALNNVEKINKEMFTLIVDYNDINKNNKKNRVGIQLKNWPGDFLNKTSIKIKPEKVEYFLRKK